MAHRATIRSLRNRLRGASMVSVRGVASIYARGQHLWGRLKNSDGEWISRRTGLKVGQEELARKKLADAQRILDAEREASIGGPMTVSRFAERWLKEREKRGLRSVRDDKGRINNHVLPKIGKLKLNEVRPRHIRDLVRALRQDSDIAPRTIRNTYGIAHAMFHDAEVDELIPSNPCKLKRGELPGKTDKDPEWRNAATYTLEEVELLITSPLVPMPRRIQYALKALAGLRHGEVAGLCWRHYDTAPEPLHRLLVATSYDTKRTKTEVTRRVPVHPALADLLKQWREDWTEAYGRKPKPTDLMVPTKNLTMVDANDAVRAMKYDLGKLELRVDAGEHRDRGGHDLRAWFITTCQENGAHRDLLRVVTHTGKGDVLSGYTRASWPALCAEVAKLRVFVASRDVS
jgi:integrase